MMWVRRDMETKQIKVDSPNITAMILMLRRGKTLVASIYIPGGDEDL